MTFKSLGLSRPVLEALDALELTNPTPIQTQAIPPALEGRDVVGLAQTGTGKTAAFALPMIDRLADGGKPLPKKVRALILSPTRELAQQISKSVRDYTSRVRLRSAVVVGGVSIRPQIKILSYGVDILIATPGRLEDLIKQKAVELDRTEIVVLDEADQMMDIGFMPAIRRLLKLTSSQRQTMLFSATMPKEIRELAATYLSNPVEVAVTPAARTADRIEQTVMHIPGKAKMAALSGLIRERAGERVIVFTRTKRGADKASRRLEVEGVASAAIHGNKSQGQRDRALAGFRDGSLPVLIATDIAARGIDVPGVSLVVNYELPNVPEVYVHRIGRTARAGAAGQAVTLCAPDERSLLRDIEKLIKLSIPVVKAPEGTFDDALSDEQLADERPERRNGGREQKANGRRTAGPKPHRKGQRPERPHGERRDSAVRDAAGATQRAEHPARGEVAARHKPGRPAPAHHAAQGEARGRAGEDRAAEAGGHRKAGRPAHAHNGNGPEGRSGEGRFKAKGPNNGAGKPSGRNRNRKRFRPGQGGPKAAAS